MSTETGTDKTTRPGERMLLTGNHAASYGAMLSGNANDGMVIAAYPITPQTDIIKRLSDMAESGGLINSRYIPVESEHSALAVVLAASQTGARAFTATSSQGLLLMTELLWWAAGARAPLVMVNVNRAIGPGWSIWTDQQDSLSMRDTGWLQYYCADNQEILDSVIMGYRIGEKIGMPVMVILDAFVLSHTAQEVFVPELEAVKEFLPNFENPNRLDTENPAILGGLTTPEFYPSFRRKLDRALALVPEVEAEVEADFERIFGRKYTAVEGYMHEDAEILMVTSATLARTVKVSIDAFRKAGVKVGVLRIRRFRPFPNKQVQEMLKNAKKVIVVDRNISLGGEGIFATEIKAALYGSGISPKLYTYIAGLGGNDITPEKLTDMITYAIHTDEPWKDPEWIGLLPTEEEKAAAEAANEVQA